MPSGCCCVVGCASKIGHSFPKDKKRRQQWTIAVRRDKWKPTDRSIVCPKHFLPQDYLEQYVQKGTLRQRNRLKRDAVPSVFPWTRPQTSVQVEREKSKQKRDEAGKLRTAEEQKAAAAKKEADTVFNGDFCIASEEVVCCSFSYVDCDKVDSSMHTLEGELKNQEEPYLCQIMSDNDSVESRLYSSNDCVVEQDPKPYTVNSKNHSETTIPCTSIGQKHLQCDDFCFSSSFSPTVVTDRKEASSSELLKESSGDGMDDNLDKTVTTEPYLSVDSIKGSDKLVHFYTGLESFNIFMAAFWSLGDNVNHLRYSYSENCSCLSPENQFLLMLVKLRRHYPHFELGRMFVVSEFSVQNIFVTWINFCHLQWSEINCWPQGKLVRYKCPTDFRKKFPSTRVILDATEIRIKQPSNPRSQKESFSAYKHGNTMKVLVGVTPGGLTSYVSDAYAGSTSDRQIVERSALAQLCEKGDSVMADKGFNVQDMFAPRDVQVNILAFFKKKNRLSPKTLQMDRKIASKRVHVERIIGMAKVYTICQHRLTILETKLATQIISVCFFLCNFRRTVVSRFA